MPSVHIVLFQIASTDVSMENAFLCSLVAGLQALVQSLFFFWLHNHLDNFRYINGKSSLEEKKPCVYQWQLQPLPQKTLFIFSVIALIRWIGKDVFGFHVILQSLVPRASEGLSGRVKNYLESLPKSRLELYLV